MTGLLQREQIIGLITEAESSGARREKACEVAGISIRTLQRWQPTGTVPVRADRRPEAIRPEPANKLSEQERQTIPDTCHKGVYASLPPSQIVPMLADQGQYLGSESGFYRILHAENQLHHRGRSKAPTPKRRPTTHTATGPNQVWTWDVTWLPSTVTGRFFYLYMVEDLFSRYGVAWEVHETKDSELASRLMQQAVWREKLVDKAKPVLHSDNGSMMKSLTLRAKLDDLGISQSFSRPRVSNDNAYVESFFHTLKYGPTWPVKGFATLEEARDWVQQFMQWYNHEHRHSKIRFVTPAQRHRGEDTAILAKRKQVYEAARAANPTRWSGETRDWSPITKVMLNPEHDNPSEEQVA